MLKQNSRQQNPFYWRIPILFGLLGGGLGGVPLVFLDMNILRWNILEHFQWIALATIIGFIPALITGFLAMLLRVKRDVWGIISTVMIGTLVSALYGVLIFRFAEIFAALGGLSALILSFFVLPATKENTPTTSTNSK